MTDRYIVMKTNKNGAWDLWQHTVYTNEQTAQAEIDRAVNVIVRQALFDAARMNSAIRGVNAPIFNDLVDRTLAYRQNFKIVRVGVTY